MKINVLPFPLHVAILISKSIFIHIYQLGGVLFATCPV